MPTAPDPTGDAYQTLGLAPGASLAEVKRAYRLLAKAFHPDSAGEAALPRFLAIHEAYDRIVTGRPSTGARTSRPAGAPASTAEPWRADPARARAAREKARTKNGSARTGTSGAGPAPGAAASGTRTTGGSRTSGGTRTGGRRTVRKATMGSTSYDEARDANDPTWSGASWYGPSSGEYWIVNPREYADPRKHGPEYQSRARRPLPGDAEAEIADGPMAATATTPGSTHARARSGAPAAGYGGQTGPSGGTPGDTPRAWVGAQPTSTWTAPAESPARAAASVEDARQAGQRAPAAAHAVSSGSRAPAWLGPSDDPIRRLGLALIAWPPLGLAAAALIGDVTGCASYSAACDGPEPLLPWLAQAGILGVLLLLPPVTRILAGGAVAILLSLVPMTLFLVAIGGAGAPQLGFVMAVLLGIAWLVGVGWSVMTTRARPPLGTQP